MADVNQVVDNTLDSLNKARTSRPEAGSSRKGDNPVLFLVGNSTMRTGTLGNGNNNGDGAILLVNISIPTGLLLRIMRWVEPVAVLSITVYGRM